MRTAAQPPESEWVQALAQRLRFAEVRGANREPSERFAVQEWGIRFAGRCGRSPRSAAVYGGSTQGANLRTANPESRGHTSEMSRCSPPYGTFRRKDPLHPGSVASKPLWLRRHSGHLARASSEGFRASMDRNLPSPSAFVARRKMRSVGSCPQSSAAVRRRRKPHPIIPSNPQLSARVGSTWPSYAPVTGPNPRVADEAVYVVNASRVRVHGMEGIDITSLICHSGWGCSCIGLDGPWLKGLTDAVDGLTPAQSAAFAQNIETDLASPVPIPLAT